MPPKTTPPTSDAALAKDALVMYENDGVPLLAAILDRRKEKYLLLNQRGREVEMTPDRLYPLATSLPATCTTTVERTAQLQALAQQGEKRAAEISIQELWSLVLDENRDYSCSELCALYFGTIEPLTHLGLRYALLADRIYFKRRKEIFEPRPKSTADELHHAEELQRRKLELQELTVQAFAALRKDPQAGLPAAVADNVRLLEDVAAGNETLDNQRHRDARELLALCCERLKIDVHGSPQERTARFLEQVGHFNDRTNLTIIRLRPPLSFSEIALKEAEELRSKVAAIEHDKTLPSDSTARRDLTGIRSITIDDASTRDMDDALSFEQLVDGFRFGIHISDVASVIPDGSRLDLEARQRATSIYCADRTIHMLPDTLAQDGLSLIQAAVRPCLSCIFETNRNFEIRHSEIVPTLIRVQERLTYEDADERLDREDFELTTLYGMAAAHEVQRIQSGGTKINKREALVVVNDDGSLKLIEVDEDGPARRLVAEMMVMANGLYADFAKEHRLPIAYRRQEPPDPHDASRYSGLPEGPARDYAIRTTLKKSIISLEPGFHATLGLQAYSQVTSPIRRWLDLAAQRQIAHFLRHGTALYTAEQFQKLLEDVDEGLNRATIITRETRRFWLLRYLELLNREKVALEGTVIRTDLKHPIAELERIYLPLMFKPLGDVNVGDHVHLKVTSLNPLFDSVRLEQITAPV